MDVIPSIYLPGLVAPPNENIMAQQSIFDWLAGGIFSTPCEQPVDLVSSMHTRQLLFWGVQEIVGGVGITTQN